MTLAFVFVDCTEDQLASVEKNIREVQGVLEAYPTTGIYDLILKVVADDEIKLQAVIASIKSISGVTSAVTNIVYNTNGTSVV
jgi:DNA-binding Lrp family transcriptional regulator